jgi:hypothetical protein
MRRVIAFVLGYFVAGFFAALIGGLVVIAINENGGHAGRLGLFGLVSAVMVCGTAAGCFVASTVKTPRQDAAVYADYDDRPEPPSVSRG